MNLTTVTQLLIDKYSFKKFIWLKMYWTKMIVRINFRIIHRLRKIYKSFAFSYKTTKIQHFPPPLVVSTLQCFVSPLPTTQGSSSLAHRPLQIPGSGFWVLCRWRAWFTSITCQSYLHCIHRLKIWGSNFPHKWHKCPKLPNICCEVFCSTLSISTVNRPKFFDRTCS